MSAPLASVNVKAQAEAVAKLRPSGALLRIEVTDGGQGYREESPPLVTVSPPPDNSTLGLERRDRVLFGETAGGYSSDSAPIPKVSTAAARAVIQNGTVVAVMLETSGAGYIRGAPKIKIASPPAYRSEPGSPREKNVGASTAKAVAVLDQEIACVDVVKPGYGYSMAQTITLAIEPPAGANRSVWVSDPLGSSVRRDVLSPTQSITPP